MRFYGRDTLNPAEASALPQAREALRIVLPYAVFSILWITMSDILLTTLVSSQRVRLELSIYKGWFFVLITSVLLIFLLRVEKRKRERIDRERADEARRYLEIFDSVGEAIIIHESDGRMIEANRTALEMFGYPDMESFLPATIAVISADEPSYSQHNGEAHVTAAFTQGRQLFPWRCRRKDGTLFWAEVSLKKSLLSGHSRVLAVVRDTSDRTRMEDELRASQERYEALFRASHGYVVISNLDTGCLVDANEAFATAFGGRDQIMGRRLLELGVWPSPKDRDDFLQSIEQAGGKLKDFDARLHLGTSGLRNCLISASAITLDGARCILSSALDVTEARRIEDALRESERRYRLIADNTDDVIWLYDLALDRFTYVSPSVERVTGYRPTEVLQHSMSDALAPSSLEIVRAALPDRLSAYRAGNSDATTRLLVVDQVRKDGSTVPTEVMTRLVPGTQNDGVQILGVTRNITERRHAQAELIRNKTWLERAERIGRIGGWAVDLQTGQIWASPEAQRIYGLTDKMFVFGEVQALVIAEHRPLLDARWVGLIERGERYDIEFQIQRQTDGAIVDIRSAAEYDKEAHSVFGVIRDTTDEKRIEAKVRQQAALLDIANDAIYVRTLDFRITFWNKGAERLYGWTAQEVEGKSSTELFSNRDIQTESIESALLTAGFWTGERTHSTKDGRTVTVLARLTLIHDKAGAPQAVFAINTDITEQKRMEARFLRAQRLESLGALASGIAHDLNNVLAPILLSIPLLKEETTSSENAAVLDTIEASARRGADVVKQVLTFARGLPGERATISLDSILAEMIKMARETFPRNISIFWPEPHASWNMIGDATQVHQAIMNLMVNSRDAMQAGGQLSLVAENIGTDEMKIREPEETPGDYVCIRVSDTGTGIPASVIENIFDPFYTTKPAGQGTGLGLSTVLGIMRSHGGFVRVHSNEGIGTTMELYFPAISRHSLPNREKPSKLLPLGLGERVLLVDDEAAVRDILQRVLERQGYRVFTASDGNEAVEIYVRNRAQISAVISDMMMPGMDGPTFVRIVRKIDPAIPILAISGIGDKAALNAVEDVKLSAFITKPFSNERLLDALASALHFQGP